MYTYNGCEISLTAIADSGYTFSHWTDLYDNIISEEDILFVSLNDYQEFKAHFEKCEDILYASIYSDKNNIYSDVMSSNNLYLYQWYQNGIPISTDSTLIQPTSGIYQLQITSNNCSALSNEISFQSNVNIDESHEDISVNIYPNPFKYQATLDLSSFQNNSLQICIKDTKGRMVREYKNIEQSKLGIKRENLTSGVYILELKHLKSIKKKIKIK